MNETSYVNNNHSDLQIKGDERRQDNPKTHESLPYFSKHTSKGSKSSDNELSLFRLEFKNK